MKRYLALPGFFFALALLGACMVAPGTPGQTTTTPELAEPTFTATAALTETTVLTTTIVTTTAPVTSEATLTTTLGVTATPAVTESAPVTAATVLTATPVLAPTAVATTAQSVVTPLPAGQLGTIAATLAARPEFATLNRAVALVQLVDELNGDAPYTLFAPTEEAFAALPPGTLDALMASPSTMASVLQNHLLIEEASSARLVQLGTVLTALGQTLPVTLTAAGTLQLGDTTLVEADIEATNGVIHAIDTVLLPVDLVIPPVVAAAATPTLMPTVTATQAVTTVQIITTIAPTATLADIVSETPELEMLEMALGAAGLLPALQLPGQLTLFAPTNAAFETLPSDQLQTLLNTTGDLAAVMQYHLVADNVMAADLVRLGTALSTSSQPLTITTADDGTVLVNSAQLIQADIVATNGVIHLINGVLLPPAE